MKQVVGGTSLWIWAVNRRFLGDAEQKLNFYTIAFDLMSRRGWEETW